MQNIQFLTASPLENTNLRYWEKICWIWPVCTIQNTLHTFKRWTNKSKFLEIARTKNDNKRSKHAYGHPANAQSKADINFDKGNVSRLFRILWNWIACVLMFNVCFYRKSTSVNRHTNYYRKLMMHFISADFKNSR
jgi:hypothetical protein